jgi:hypothetical protein
MMSFLPGLIPLIYLIVQRRWGWAIGSILLLFVMSNSIQAQLAKPQQVLSRDAYQELVNMKGILPGGQNLIYAPHGLEWWVAWTMATDITNRTEIALNSLDEYDHVFLIEQNNASTYELYSDVERFFPTFRSISSSYMLTMGNSISVGSSANHLNEIYRGDFFTLKAVKR